jgi:hypothetical protein
MSATITAEIEASRLLDLRRRASHGYQFDLKADAWNELRACLPFDGDMALLHHWPPVSLAGYGLIRIVRAVPDEAGTAIHIEAVEHRGGILG